MTAFLQDTECQNELLDIADEKPGPLNKFDDKAAGSVRQLVALMLLNERPNLEGTDGSHLAIAGRLVKVLHSLAQNDAAKDNAKALDQHICMCEVFMKLQSHFEKEFLPKSKVAKVSWLNKNTKEVLALQAAIHACSDHAGLTDLKQLVVNAKEFCKKLIDVGQETSLAHWTAVMAALKVPQEQALKWKSKLVKPTWTEAADAAQPIIEETFARDFKLKFNAACKDAWENAQQPVVIRLLSVCVFCMIILERRSAC